MERSKRFSCLIVVGLVMLVVSVLFVGCNPSRQPVIDYLTAAGDLLGEWSDTFNRAASTGRIALSPVIGDLQRVMRTYESLDPPEECVKLHTNVISSMDSAVDGFLAFMSQEDESVVTRHFDRSTEALERATSQLSGLRAEYLD